MNDLRTDLSKVRGHGAANEGVHEFITSRVSAMILALVFPFFLYGIMKALPGGYEGLIAWAKSAFGAFTLLIMVTAGLYHGRIGINEVIADYVPSTALRSFLLILNAMVAFGVWLMGVMAILKIWLGA
ncbi:MAG: succinate dehydrogenase, hydrophobic membrane anchor protein [Robiginitomaculum sp.]